MDLGTRLMLQGLNESETAICYQTYGVFLLFYFTSLITSYVFIAGITLLLKRTLINNKTYPFAEWK